LTDQFVWLILYSFFDIFVRKKTSIYFYFVWIRRALMLDQSKQRNVFFPKAEAWFSGYSGFVLGRKLNRLLGRILGLSWTLSLEVQLFNCVFGWGSNRGETVDGKRNGRCNGVGV